VDAAETTLRAIPGVRQVPVVRMRWIGHLLHAEAELVLDAELSPLQATRSPPTLTISRPLWPADGLARTRPA
jgi:divalent metal cation (Fe/Co/Zn/Cd) transporter